jgi:hypothetical protein
MLRQKYPAENKQHYWLEWRYRNGVKVEDKQSIIYNLVGKLPSHHGGNHFVLDFKAGLDTLFLLASDDDIEMITGDVVPIS